jgi:ankyrin repeat protein
MQTPLLRLKAEAAARTEAEAKRRAEEEASEGAKAACPSKEAQDLHFEVLAPALNWHSFKEADDYIVSRLQRALSLVVDVNLRSWHGATPLMTAASYRPGYAQSVAMLIEAGADVNLRDDKGETALMYAVRSHTPKIVEHLLLAGADVNARSEKGSTALMACVGERSTPADTYVNMLLAGGADPNIQDENGRTALIKAAINERASSIKALLAGGAPPDLRDSDGKTALMYSHRNNNMSNECVDYLLNLPIRLRQGRQDCS